MKAQAHPFQALRLATLRKYDILDTPREGDFDDIVELASEICGVPISVVNLIDKDRQWFKAEVGIGARETPLETSICSHIILESDFVEIEDTHLDPRTADNELCMAEDGLRYYAGALLKAENGMPIGTLCVLDTKPNKLTDFQRRALSVLARRVMRELELRRALKDQSVLRDEMDHRVKNSLQTISSFVRIYQGQLKKNADPKEVLDAVARRVEAVSALHEALHNALDSGHLQLDEFLERITGYLKDAAPPNVEVRFSASPMEVPANMAASIAVIISEFVANSIKHGFPDGRPGLVTIELMELPGELHIVCFDNGVGSETAEPVVQKPRSSGLGTRLVGSAASQIGASLIRTSKSDGYRLELTVPMAEDAGVTAG